MRGPRLPQDSGWQAAPVAAVVFVAAIVLFVVVLTKSPAAPALTPTPDTVTGELAIRLESPVLLTVIVGDGSEPPRESVLWLVFPTPKAETDARKFESGTRLTVTGRQMAGGAYRYVVVESITAEAKR